LANIALENLAHAYGPDPKAPSDYALKPLNITWRDGGAYALLGPSGCGKTTLLNIISGLVTPSEGRVLFDGRDMTSVTTERRNIAQVFQFPVVYDTMSVYENLAFPLKNRGLSRPEIDRRVKEIADMLDLTGSLDRRASRLTADVKQKISLGRGLVRADTAAILFDEPLTVIDPQLKWELRAQLKQLHQKVGRTMIYVTHDQTEAMTFADTVVVMYDGGVVQIGPPVELFRRPAHTFVGYFIGSPGMNVLPARVEGSIAHMGDTSIRLAHPYPRLPNDKKIEIGVRPEDLTLKAGGDGLPVRIDRVDDIGRIRIARTRFAEHDINVVVPEGIEIPAANAKAFAAPDRVHVYADGHLVEGGR
jgi:glycerol transport system ATP-binding protein